MQQPPSPDSLPSAANDDAGKKRPPGPEEILAHYESQGLEHRDAALKAIRELQSLLYKSLTSRRVKKDHSVADALSKLDKANTSLALHDIKLNSKPGFGQSLAISLASGALLQGVGAAIPHVLGGLHGMWDSVQSVIRTAPPSLIN